MKRFHIHITVQDLAASIDFYNKLFGELPSRQEEDYAKWMLEDPRINFAISSRGHASGINHLGMQADTQQELDELKSLAIAASGDTTIDPDAAACCYANSMKHWVVDPSGVAWEHFQTLSDSKTFGEDTMINEDACCDPLHNSESDKAACCN
jgi:predicted lactoylglutathione lyase